MDEPFDADVYSLACPSRVVLGRIGDRWIALIVGLLDDGSRRFGEIRDGMRITPKVPSETQQRDVIVERRAYPEMPPRVEYSLTPLALTLREPLAWCSNGPRRTCTTSSRPACCTMRRRERRV